jgi:acyl carrier protein
MGRGGEAVCFDEIGSVILDALDLQDRKLGDNEDIRELDGWDSVNHVRILIAIQATVGRKIPMDRFFECHTVEEIGRLISP